MHERFRHKLRMAIDGSSAIVNQKKKRMSEITIRYVSATRIDTDFSECYQNGGNVVMDLYIDEDDSFEGLLEETHVVRFWRKQRGAGPCNGSVA